MNSARKQSWLTGQMLTCVAAVLMGASGVQGATFDELYTVSVAADPGIAGDRAAAARRGMSVLLTRITGRQQAEAYPELAGLIAGAERYMTSYSVSGEIRVGFNERQITEALTRLNMPIWGDERPATLLWVAADFGNGERAELGAGSPPAGSGSRSVSAGSASNPLSAESQTAFDEVVGAILAAADERGLPLVLPELDQVDRQSVRFADVWGGFDPFVARAAERYDVDAVVIARIAMTDAEPDVRWTVLRGGQRDTLAPPRVRDGIDWLADTFAAVYTTVGDVRFARIAISGIEDVGDYARVLAYLDSVSVIESIDPESMSGNELLLRVAARGDDEQLRRVFALDGELVPDEEAPGLRYMPVWRAPIEAQGPP